MRKGLSIKDRVKKIKKKKSDIRLKKFHKKSFDKKRRRHTTKRFKW